MTNQYPTGPSGVSTGAITSYDNPAVLLVFIFWGLSALFFASFGVYRADRIKNGEFAGPVRARRESKGSHAEDGTAVEMVSAVVIDEIRSDGGHVVNPDGPIAPPTAGANSAVVGEAVTAPDACHILIQKNPCSSVAACVFCKA